MSKDLLADLRAGEAESRREAPCPLCELVVEQTDMSTQIALRDAAAGTIGYRKLALILSAHGHGIGRRTIERHRREGHEPL